MNAASRFAGLLLFACASLGVASAEDWPGFRGSRGGVSDDKDLPVQWTKDNVLWKMKLPGVGTSSPITSGDKLFVTAYSGYGTGITKGFSGGKGGGKGGFGGAGGDAGDQKMLKLLLLCYDAAKGELLWKKEIDPKLPEAPFTGFMREHGYASSTPATDGENVYVFFGKSGVLAFDMKGTQLWQADVGSKTDKWGSATSPVLFNNLVIVNACIESGSLVALDKTTGKEVWRKKGIATCWVSPMLAATKEGKQELVMNLPGKIVAYDPANGDELWNCAGIGGGQGGYTGATPVARDGVVYVIGGGGPGAQPASMAIRTGGKGDVTATHLLWKQKAGTNTCSPVLCGDSLVWVNGTVVSINRADGKIAYQERLYGAKGEYVSAVAAGDKIFALTRFDGLFVIAGGDKFQKLSHFDFEGDTSIFNASPAISNGRIYLRSNDYLYCVGKKS